MADQPVFYSCSKDDTPDKIIILMLETGVKEKITDALEMMKDDNSLCTYKVRTLLNDMVEQDISVGSITGFLSEIGK
jgi:hypothetical protein